MFLFEDPVTAARLSLYFTRLLSALIDLWLKARCLRSSHSPAKTQCRPATKRPRR